MKIEIPTEYERKNHRVGGSFWHFQWCTKYRYNMFRKEYYNNLCKILIIEACKRHNIELLVLIVKDTNN